MWICSKGMDKELLFFESSPNLWLDSDGLFQEEYCSKYGILREEAVSVNNENSRVAPFGRPQGYGFDQRLAADPINPRDEIIARLVMLYTGT